MLAFFLLPTLYPLPSKRETHSTADRLAHSSLAAVFLDVDTSRYRDWSQIRSQILVPYLVDN